jgi:hypothetical protein
MFLRLFNKNNVDEFSFGETGLRFFLADPLPEIVEAIAKWRRH